MAVNATHPNYDKSINRWQTVRDVVTSNVKQYINDVDSSDSVRNARYKKDARFTNFTGRTKQGLVGMVFRKNAEIDLPEAIDYLRLDATGSKLSLEKLSQEVVGEVIQAGRYGLLVDFPASEDGLTAAEVNILGSKARILKYKPEKIINWQSQVFNGQHVLTLVVLEEQVDLLSDDGFTWIHEKQYRVLRLIEGIYVQQLYSEALEFVSQYVPRDFIGNSWEHIPFTFIGSEDNDADVDHSPLYDLAELNIGHLRNSADYEESVHITGQPTMIISTSMPVEQFKEANPNGVRIGSRVGLNLGEGGNAFMLQPSPNQLADIAMQRKEQQAIMIGARLVTPASSNETVDAVRLRSSGETSALDLIVQNVESAIIWCLNWANRFMSPAEITDELIFNLNNDFFEAKADPQELIAQMQLVDRGIISKSDIRHTMRKSGLIQADRTDEDIDADVGEINPLI